jgi:hypothetical protein
VGCRFRHPRNVDGTLLVNVGNEDKQQSHLAKASVPTSSEEVVGQAMCAFFMRGKCTKGESCRFSHARVDISSLAAAEAESLPPLTGLVQPETSSVTASTEITSDGKKTTSSSKRKATDILSKHSLARSVGNEKRAKSREIAEEEQKKEEEDADDDDDDHHHHVGKEKEEETVELLPDSNDGHETENICSSGEIGNTVVVRDVDVTMCLAHSAGRG